MRTKIKKELSSLLVILTIKRKGKEAEKAEKGKNNRSKEGSGEMEDLG